MISFYASFIKMRKFDNNFWFNVILAFIFLDFLIVYSIVIEANFPDSQFDILYRTY